MQASAGPGRLVKGSSASGTGPRHGPTVSGPEVPLLYGLDRYWRERERFVTRLTVSLLTVSGIAVLGALLLMARPDLRTVIENPERFGFEGPTQFVNRIRLEAIGPEERGGKAAVDYVTAESRRGGRSERGEREARPVIERKPLGEGLDDLDWNARARLLRLDAPIIRSEELIALHLARPEYPDLALEMDQEGSVELMAMIDTLGSVKQVQIFGGSRDSSFERAAIDAAFKNRYKPYLQNSLPQIVWVPLRYSFTIGRRP